MKLTRKLKTKTAAAIILKIVVFISSFLYRLLRMIAVAVFVFNFLVNLRLKQINLSAYAISDTHIIYGFTTFLLNIGI